MLSPRYLGATGAGLGSCQPESINIGSMHPLKVMALPAAEVYRRYFADAFVLRGAYALGFLVRRSMETVVPGAILDVLGRVECTLGRVAPLVSRGRFFVLDLERRLQ